MLVISGAINHPPTPLQKALVKTSEGFAAPKEAADAGLVPGEQLGPPQQPRGRQSSGSGLAQFKAQLGAESLPHPGQLGCGPCVLCALKWLLECTKSCCSCRERTVAEWHRTLRSKPALPRADPSKNQFVTNKDTSANINRTQGVFPGTSEVQNGLK